MKNWLLTFCFVCAPCILAAADPPPIHVETPAAAGARYAIVQSTVRIRDTFRLDRFTGRIHRVVKDDDGSLVWEEMVVHNRPKIQSPGAPRFQLFLSGMAVRHTYLLDMVTGDTWQVMVVENDIKTPSEGTQDESQKITEWFPVNVYDLKK